MKLLSSCILFFEWVGQTVYECNPWNLGNGKLDIDDLEPQKKPKEIKNLEIMSVEALNDYIAELEEEISRVRSAISLKESARDGAESFFKK